MIPQRFAYYLPLPILLLLHGFTAAGQNVVFTATAEAAKMGLNDQIQVSYTIRDAENLQTMGPGNIKDFLIVAGPFQSQSSNISIIGNRTVQTMSVSLTYVLQPRHTGNLVIPAGTAKDASGHTYQSNAVNIQVVPGSLVVQQRRQANDPMNDDSWGNDLWAAMRQQQQRMLQAQAARQQQMRQQPQQAQAAPVSQADLHKDLFIKVNVDKQNIRVGEQVTATYKLYARIPMQVGISKLPSLNGFWTQDFELPKQPKPQEEIVDGKKYQVFTLKKSALFPQQTGKLVLDPAEAEGTARIIQQVRQRNPFADMFDDPFFRQSMGGSLSMSDPFFNDDIFSSMAYKDIPVHLKSQPVTVNVSALPDKDAPADFGGAVGNFTINAKMDKDHLTTDDAASLQLTINGSGNFKLIQAPKLQLPNGLDTYDPVTVDTITSRSTMIGGSKIITYSITPRTPGDYTIPGIAFSYFNPQSGTYNTLHTQPFHLQVKPGKHYNPTVAKVAPGLKDIHGNALQVPHSFTSSNARPLPLRPAYWSLYALPLLALIGISFWKRRDEELNSNTMALKNKRANKVALKRLTAAKSLLQQNQSKAFYEEISKAIWLYLSDKLGIPLSSLSKQAAADALTDKHVPVMLQRDTEQVMQDCELALYAPSGGQQQMQRTYEQAVSIISKLEDYLQR